VTQIHHTFCRNCNAQCGLTVGVADNMIVSMAGDRADPLTRGYCCVKGLASKDLHNGEDRLISPRRGRGAVQADIAAEQALDEIAERLGTIIDRHGPRAVGLYYGTGVNFNALGHSVFKAWLSMLGSPYVFSSMTLDQSAKWVATGRMGYFAAGQHYVHDADVALMVGMNPLISHAAVRIIPVQNPRRWIQEAKARGTKLIVVDPRLTETAKYADLHLQVRPGEDVTLFAGLIRIVLERGWENRGFCARFIGPLDGLRAAVEDFTPDHVAERVGIPLEQIEMAAQMFAQAKRPTAGTGTGPDMSPHSNLAEHLVQVLTAICGGYRRAGDLVRNPGFLIGPRAFKERVVPPARTWEGGPKLRTQDIGRIFGEYPTALLPDEILGRGEDRIRALVVVGGNPVMALVDPKKTLRAFEKLELLVSLDCRRTETTARSDYVIASCLPYERFDVTAMFDNYNPMSYGKVTTPLLQRPSGTMEDWEFFWGIASRMGRPLELKRPMFGTPHEQIPGPALTLDPTVKPTAESLIRWMASAFGVTSYEELLSHPHGLLREDLVTTVQAADEDDGARLDVLPADVALELAAVQATTPTVGYRYRLTVRRLLETMNSAYSNASSTRRRYAVNPAFMNPLDMAAEGIQKDAAITISSEHGSIVAHARPDSTLRRGVISVAHCWGTPEQSADPDGRTGAFTGRLAALDVQREAINFMPRQSAIPVNVLLHPRAPT
jgi:anaerobic selenocysteine-containing dehydrogenase